MDVSRFPRMYEIARPQKVEPNVFYPPRGVTEGAIVGNLDHPDFELMAGSWVSLVALKLKISDPDRTRRTTICFGIHVTAQVRGGREDGLRI